MNLTRNRDHIIEGGEDHKPARQGNFATQAWALGGDGFLEDLHEDVRLLAQHLGDLARFDDFRLRFEFREVETLRAFILHRHLGELEQGARIGAQVCIVQESVLFKPHVHKCRVQAGDEFLHLTQVKIAHGEAGVCFFTVPWGAAFIMSSLFKRQAL